MSEFGVQTVIDGRPVIRSYCRTCHSWMQMRVYRVSNPNYRTQEQVMADARARKARLADEAALRQEEREVLSKFVVGRIHYLIKSGFGLDFILKRLRMSYDTYYRWRDGEIPRHGKRSRQLANKLMKDPHLQPKPAL
jgi:hypothetical protein